jgi:hypothetical protein
VKDAAGSRRGNVCHDLLEPNCNERIQLSDRRYSQIMAEQKFGERISHPNSLAARQSRNFCRNAWSDMDEGRSRDVVIDYLLCVFGERVCVEPILFREETLRPKCDFAIAADKRVISSSEFDQSVVINRGKILDRRLP